MFAFQHPNLTFPVVVPDWLEVICFCWCNEYFRFGVYIVNMKTFDIIIFGRAVVLSLLKSHDVS